MLRPHCLTLAGGCTELCSPRPEELRCTEGLDLEGADLPKSAGSAVPNLLIWRYFPCTDDSFRDLWQANHWEESEMELFRNMQCLLHSSLVSLAMIFQ